MSNKLRIAGIMLALMSTSALAQQQRYVAFGDSLSDNGNFFAATGQPPAPYFNGRFSNGPTWVELLSVAPMSGFFPVGPVNNAASTNFAFGGARTDGAPGTATAPNISGGSGAQITNYLARGGAFTPTTAATLWAGANDIFQGLPIAGAVPATAQATMQGIAGTAAANVAGQVGQLAAAGARQVLVLNLPNFGTLPQFAGGPASALAGFSTSVFNSALATAVGTVAAGAPGANIVQVDVSGAFTALQANPASFGFTNASDQCLTTPACVGVPAARDGFAFWDGVHPTAAGHRLVAAIVGQYLNAPVLAGVYSALGEVAVDERRIGMTRSFDRLDSIRFGKPGANDYFVNIIGGTANGDASASRPSFRASNYGVNFGLNRSLTSNWGLSASGSFTVGKTKVASLLSADTFNAAFDVAGIYSAGMFFAKAGAGLGVTQFGDMERRTVGPLVNRSSATAVIANVGVEAGVIYSAGMFELSPRARLGWLGGSFGAINESGVVAPLAIRSRDISTFVAGAELRATANIVNTPGQKVSVTALVGYERYLGYTGNSLDARLAGNTAQAFRNVSSDPRGPGVILGAGLSSQMVSGWVFSADYRASIGERNLVRHTGQIGVRTSF